ncbi:Bifunctional polynucleotide phosphatase/kinase [Portunus trituberculatus]|uniref:Bifunctional polynucleotide phosphatase/kinase n=1 Tax=Portunus trituberculatus TaxID=210409 RepID=A0A5B7CFJ6_PORTR|nr:Bifunctional polynucleotide phosphatase/kinase [Portunus trituberculatus]
MVTAKATRCWLSCLANLHPPILLPHNQPCVIGRSRETKIRDTRCSKSQVELLADYTSYIVTARQLGANSSSVNGQKVLYGSSAQLQHGDIIEVLAGGYEHRVDFDPPPTSTNTVNSTTEPEQDTAMPRGQKKRTIDDHFSNPKKAKTGGTSGSGGWEKSIDGDLLVYQKNMTGSEKANGGVEVDLDKSIFVGDAAGRPAEGKKKKDFSFSDRLFALNVGLKFYTPEEHFLDAKTQAFNMPEFDPRKVDASLPLYDPSMTKVPGHKLEMIVLVGFPGSGKSFFCSTHLAPLGYVVANRDTIGSWQKCVSVMEQSLKIMRLVWQDGKHVVIDNTNPDLESRKRYIEAAKKCGATVRCFIFATSKDHARHNNKFREFSEEDHSKVSDMVFNMYNVQYKMM